MTRVGAGSLAEALGLEHPQWSSEGAFQSDVVAQARANGWGLTIKQAKNLAQEAAAYRVMPPPLDGLIFHPRYSLGSEPGWPDLVLVRRADRRVLFRELKTDAGKVSQRQADVLELLAYVGLDVAIWRPRDWAGILQELAA
jgi:hypothetical protein